MGPPVFSVYVIHRFNAGAGAAQFKVSDTTGLFATTHIATLNREAPLMTSEADVEGEEEPQ